MCAVPACLALLILMACLPSAARARESQFTMFEAPTELLSDDEPHPAPIRTAALYALRVMACGSAP